MNSGRRNRWTRIALAVVVAIGVASTAGAQQAPAGRAAGAQGRGRGGDPNAGAPYTPAAGAKDLRAVLFNWMWHQGMLKGTDERDMVATLEYQAKGGTIQVDGQPCTLTKYRASTNYQTLSQRINYSCTRANKQTYSNIEVVSWQYAWNEDTPGAEIAGTKGKVAAMPAAVQERLIRLWASPQGAPKSALAGTMDTWTLGANPGVVVPDGVMKVGNTSVSWDTTGKPVVTFPIPGVPGATGTATLDANYMTEKVVVTQGADDDRVHLQRLQGLEQPAEQDRGVLRGQDDRAQERRGGPRSDDGRDGDGQCVCRRARAAERAEGDERHDEGAHDRVCEAGAADEHDGPDTADRRASRSDGQLGGIQHRLDWQLHGQRRAALRSEPAEALQQSARIRPRISSSTHRRASASWVARSTSRSTGTRFSSSTCGPTRKIR